MKKNSYNFLPCAAAARGLWALLALLLFGSPLWAAAPVRQLPAGVLADYCFNTPNYSFKAETTGPNVTFTFSPVGATAGGNLAIIYIREGSAGAYAGYNMVKNAVGDFVLTRAIATGVVLSVYFTYEVGAGGPQQNSAATPHSYTVGTNCLVSASNVPPTVSMTAPTASGAVFAAPATIVLAANAADSDGTIAKVEFFQGTTLLGQDLTAPYTYTWTGVIGDTYSLTAKATDNGNANTTSTPVSVLVQSADGYCATRPDYAYSAVTTGANVTFTFHPIGATAGGNLAIVFIREGSIGAYPGYTMVKNAVGDFTFTKAIGSGTITSVYFTYEIGPGGPQQTSVSNPHSYTVGTSCRISGTTATAGPMLTTPLSLAPNPGQDRTQIRFAPTMAGPYQVTLSDVRGRQVAVVGAGKASAGQQLVLPLSLQQLANGIYLVQLLTGQGVATQRLVVNR
ncbi:Por secretion system C-terminal sorting domain-containing protein [Hymenobacter daecheongensis DSM 21074]|uniref:Por secretion system C-terminal sorting domain-containing protein n=1 Tax=Hymenobacter daecheongensis DSM 21074 TaxID=1121955 RepID=A0A1M6GSX7_9BACT|nr:Ig-like domain-containing protein [Hymenobacter daecheongensis]SHJ13002.1 Por secretion system C-terminal sorting domain-containing protein [Hymenobacter daecheongensis DSM 21074]